MRKSIPLIIAIFCFFSVRYSRAASQYELFDLGTMGHDWSCAESINNQGVIAGNTEELAFKMVPYSKFGLPFGPIRILPFDDDEYGLIVAEIQVYSINDKNEIAGWVYSIHDGWNHAIMWDDDIDHTTYLMQADDVTDINNSSQVIAADGYPRGTYGFGLGTYSVLWDDSEISEIASWSLNGILDSCPSAINDKGVVVGIVRSSEDEDRDDYAFLWQDGDFNDLNALYRAAKGHLEHARDINNLRQIVGHYKVTRADGSIRNSSFLISGGDVRDIGFRGARAINDKGQIVGSHYLYENYQKVDPSGLLHEYGGRCYNLNKLIRRKVRPHCWNRGSDREPICFYSPAEYKNLSVRDINNSGQIVGSATIDDEEHAVLLNPIP